MATRIETVTGLANKSIVTIDRSGSVPVAATELYTDRGNSIPVVMVGVADSGLTAPEAATLATLLDKVHARAVVKAGFA